MAKSADRRAVFLDRDGVLNEDHGYVYRPNELVVLPGVPEALAELKRRGFLTVVVSNQSGVARGYFSLAEVDVFNEALQATIVARNPKATLDGFYVCPHHEKGSVPDFTRVCSCRKPGISLVRQAVDDHGISLAGSYLVGDKPSDIDCALNAGMQGIQVTGTAKVRHPRAIAHVDSLIAALPYLV